uniref:Uncharacterized protein n=1 Tax=Octopus bimaculoides TaxID=37653 RepID=A0A0L8H856_OCTBM
MSNTTRDDAKLYMAQHGIPQLFECLLSCLLLERPPDPIKFIEQKIAEVKLKGVKSINWETFMCHLHPYCDHYKSKTIIRDRNRLNQGSNKITSEMVSTGYKPNTFELTETHRN